ncbi:MAG: glycosyltransferase [Terracidiphilus sp.]|jgi:GT2 family glycosyltransferase
MKARIIAVIVLYNTTVEESVSYSSLLRAAEAMPFGELDLAVILFSNTAGAVEPQGLPPSVLFLRSPNNCGLAAAYNRTLDIAIEGGYEWMLTLDQDTKLPSDTFRVFVDTLMALDRRPDVAAVVPQIRAKGRIISPNWFSAGAWPRMFPSGFTGIPSESVYAFNSASLLRISALRQISGYSPWFWLDNSDSYLYRQLSKFGKRVYVAGNLKVEHDFSMLNMRERLSPERYRNILLSESAFWDMEMNGLAGLERTARLAARLIKHLLRRDSMELQRLTGQAFLMRMFRSREYRIARWREATQARLGAALKGYRKPSDRPMVSVCMAAYNGAPFIEAQLRSILPQLAPTDEIVIVDDASRDGTVDCILRIRRELERTPGAPRMLLIQHQTNRGVVSSFEEAVRCATGDILFFSDDDDLWAPNKVHRILDVFAAQPGKQVVSTGFSLIDEHDLPAIDSEFLRHRRFTPGLAANLLHNQFQGSTMAFRSTLIKDILPFPPGKLFLHDAWIGSRNLLEGGGTAHIDEPLLLYRRHSGNYTRRLSRLNQIRRRMQLIASLLPRAIHKLGGGDWPAVSQAGEGSPSDDSTRANPSHR